MTQIKCKELNFKLIDAEQVQAETRREAERWKHMYNEINDKFMKFESDRRRVQEMQKKFEEMKV